MKETATAVVPRVTREALTPIEPSQFRTEDACGQGGSQALCSRIAEREVIKETVNLLPRMTACLSVKFTESKQTGYFLEKVYIGRIP